MSIIQAVIFGVVEGFTEFLPISSTGHLILLAKLLDIPDSVFTKTFEIAIQSGAILAVVALYIKRIIYDRDLVKKVLAAFVPTAILGFFLYSFIKGAFFDVRVVLVALFLGGILLIIFEYWHVPESAEKEKPISYWQALLIGIFQSVAFIPGVSRAGATIVGGLLLGIGRKSIVEFSFLLAIPTMLAATGYDILKNYQGFSAGDFGVLAVGFATSFVFALIGIRFLIQFIESHSFKLFGVYRMVLSVAAWFLIF